MKMYDRPVRLGHKQTVTSASATAQTVNYQTFDITTASLSTAAGATATFTVTNSLISAYSKVIANIGWGSATAGTPVLIKTVVSAGSVVFTFVNAHATNALNGTLKITGFVINPGDIVNA